MIRPHLAHEPLRFDSVDMLRLEVRWVDVKGPVSYTHLTLPTICSV